MKRIVFLHIPKCGGSTIRDKIIKRLKGEGRILKIYNDNADQDYYTPTTFRDRFAVEMPSDVKAIIGHINCETLSEIIDIDEWDCFSIVRHPIDRAISNINYIRLSPSHPAHEGMMKVTEESLFDKIASMNKALQQEFLGGGNHLHKITVWKLENYLNALKYHHILVEPHEEVIVKNVTLNKKSKSGLRTQLFTKRMLTSMQLDELDRLFRPDLELYQSAL